MSNGNGNGNGKEPAPAPAAPPRAMRMDFNVERSGRGYRGFITIPLLDGKRVIAQAPGKDRAQALGKAAAIAKKIEANPVLAALLPPQAALALKATTALAKADALGKFEDVAKKVTGPAMDRLKSLFGG